MFLVCAYVDVCVLCAFSVLVCVFTFESVSACVSVHVCTYTSVHA